MCLRIGKMSVTERIGGIKRVDVVRLFGEVLRYNPRQAEMLAEDRFSSPIVAWFKPHETLPLERLMCGLAHADHDTPTVNLSDRQQHLLLEQFMTAVYPVCCVVSMADTQGTDDVSAALRAAIFYAAAVSMPLLETQPAFGMAKEPLVKALKTAVEDSLCQVGIFDHLDVKLFQAIIIYLTPQFIGEVSRSHSVFLAAVTRHFLLAEFNRDSFSDSNPTRHLKRHLWQHLLLLNLRSTEAVGPEASLVEDLDAKLPDLAPDGQQWHGFPTSIVALVRYECHKIHRMIFREREDIRNGRSTYLSTERKIEQSIKHIYETYLNKLDESQPIQKYAKVVGKLLTHKAEGMIRHPQWEDAKVSTIGNKLRDR